MHGIVLICMGIKWYCMVRSCIDSVIVILACWIYTGTLWRKELQSELTKARLGMLHSCNGVRSNPGVTKSQNIPGNDQLGFPELFLFSMMERVPGDMLWAKVAHFGPPGTPRKSAFFYERGQKRVKGHLKALKILVILRCVGA